MNIQQAITPSKQALSFGVFKITNVKCDNSNMKRELMTELVFAGGASIISGENINDGDNSNSEQTEFVKRCHNASETIPKDYCVLSFYNGTPFITAQPDVEPRLAERYKEDGYEIEQLTK